MAGRGPAPKPQGTAAGHRRKNDPTPTRSMQLVRVKQPPLPDHTDWHEQTRSWWANWGQSVLADDFTATDWDYLIETALMHHLMWAKQQWTLAAELRLRVAKFGATPEDRARLRITLEDADAKEDAGKTRRTRANTGGAAQPKGKSSDPRSILKAV